MAETRILVRGVNWLGDAVMTTPALMRLREAQPQARISLLSPAKLAELWMQHPAVDEIISFAAGESVWKVAGRLRSYRFQTGLVFPNSVRSALELWLARVPRRIGYAQPWRNWCLTRALPEPAGKVRMRKRSAREIRALVAGSAPPAALAPAFSAHQMHHYLGLVAQLGARPDPLAPCLAVSDLEARKAADKYGFKNLISQLPLVGLNPGAEYGPAKRWPEEQFAQMAARLNQQAACAWILTGGPGDAPLCARLAARLATIPPGPGGRPPVVIDLSGKTSLRELCAVLKLCRVVITNDSGPMHVAAALGTPIVALFGSTAPELTAPGLPGGPQVILRSPPPCAPCFQRTCPIDLRCLRDIPAERVADAARALLAGSRP